jgi:hypothetical protein
LLTASVLPAQHADTILLRSDNPRFTVVSQVEDPQEASAFLAIVSNTDPAARQQLAGKFVETYPRSWLLAPAYDLLARSAIDLGELERLSGDSFRCGCCPKIRLC